MSEGYDDDSYLYGDTIIECEHRRRCEALYNYLKGELE